MDREVASQLLSILAVVGALHGEGVTPPYSQYQIRKKGDELGCTYLGEGNQFLERLILLAQAGYLKVVREAGRYYAYPASKILKLSSGMVDVTSQEKQFVPGSSSHKVLDFMRRKSKGVSINEVVLGGSISDEPRTRTVRHLLGADFIDWTSEGVRITLRGRRALVGLDSGETVIVPKKDFTPEERITIRHRYLDWFKEEGDKDENW